MTRTLEQIQELRKRHAIEELTDFLSTQNKSIRELTILEYQQRVAEGINTLWDKTRYEQDRTLVQIIQYDKSFMWDN